MLTVQKCFCFELDKGGKILGWIGKISSIALIILSIIFMLIFAFSPCAGIEEKYGSCMGFKIGNL